MNDSFDYRTLTVRVLFGPGRRAEAGEAVASLGCGRALVLSTPGHRDLAESIAAALGARAAGVLAGARMHTPVEATEEALAIVREERIDGLVSVGGGSAIGLGKAIAVRTGLPQVAIPTTYAGSEMTDILGETRDGEKITRRTDEVRPRIVIYDVELTLSLPPHLSAVSGMNALAHAVEALYARDGNPVVSLMAEEGARALAEGLPAIVADPSDRQARTGALYGAWLCGICLGSASMALHHKLCHVLGGMFALPHAETHAIVLPHAAAFNAPAAPGAMVRLARALGVDDAPLGLFELDRALGAPVALRDIGMPPEGIAAAARAAVANPYWNPQPLDEAALREILEAAFDGRPPVPRT